MSLVSAPCHGKRVLIPPPADVTSAPHKKCLGTRPDNGSDLLDFCLRSAIFTCGPRPAQMRTYVGPCYCTCETRRDRPFVWAGRLAYRIELNIHGRSLRRQRIVAVTIPAFCLPAKR